MYVSILPSHLLFSFYFSSHSLFGLKSSLFSSSSSSSFSCCSFSSCSFSLHSQSPQVPLTTSIPSTHLRGPLEPKTHISPIFPRPSSFLLTNNHNHVLTLPNPRHPPAPLPHVLLLARPALASSHAQDDILTPIHCRHGDHRLGDLRCQHSPWAAHQHQEARAESRDDPDVRGTHGVFQRHRAEW